MKLHQWRSREGLSLAQMGKLIHRAHTTVMRLESGASVPDMVTMKAIFDATNGEVSLHDFLAADGSPKPQSMTAVE
jgi:transcriptional regulator with XRE-family HTH domain